MNLKHLNDNDLLIQTKQLIQSERNTLVKILHHLREVERRKLFSDLGCKSLFEYAVKELKYSEGQAGRRIQAMRLLRELPEIEQKIENGRLSLSNISQAQSYFREIKKQASRKESSMTINEGRRNIKILPDKLQILESLENKSAREGQKVLLSLSPEVPLPKERERQITKTHVEYRILVSEELKRKMEEVRSLLGAKSIPMNLADLIECMCGLSVETLKVKKFGKRNGQSDQTPTSELQVQTRDDVAGSKGSGKSRIQKSSRYISQKVKFQVWRRDDGRCQKCGSQHNLNMDHVRPFAKGGCSTKENLRLLCFHCNQREAMKEFGYEKIALRGSVARRDIS
ncbi:MAG TPA: hypothetical protein DCL41_03550 [Bdellovibrionales bacterium]|mgnify:CR=1 FL=1|nr:hypothetical protein [Pseudobdellovibrionaceae bacterium]HAG90916.1 hypothetical protein [Bdellovibrionales bacterium]